MQAEINIPEPAPTTVTITMTETEATHLGYLCRDLYNGTWRDGMVPAVMLTHGSMKEVEETCWQTFDAIRKILGLET